jgi:putative ABC transport system permease protein
LSPLSAYSRRSGRVRPVPLALELVLHKKSRTAVAAAGIGFAILVMFVQLGFYGSVLNTALAVSARFDAEIVLISPRFAYLGATGTIPAGRLYQALAQPEVQSTVPIYFRYADWRDPANGASCRLFAIGFPLAADSDASPLRLPGIDRQLANLRPTNTLLLDRLTRERCGPVDAAGRVEVRNHAAQVVGDFRMGVGFLADGAILMSDDTFSRFFNNHPLDEPHLGLIRLAPGSDTDQVAASLRESLPRDVRVITHDELNDLQTRHWVENTAVGNIFGMGTLAGFLVGVVVLFQILSTDIRNHLPLYATLRAMGYSEQRLTRYVLEQAWIYAVLGFGPALLASLVAFPLIQSATNLPIFITPGLVGGLLVLSLLMCSFSALISARRLRRADPAELF